jgi:thymidine kinase
MLTGYRFEMIVGCMRSGKSSELIRRIERARLAYLPTIIVRPTTDTRSKPNFVESRNGLASQAIVVDSPRDILKYSSQAVVIGIDECQFFSDDIIEVVQVLLSQKKKLIASGLDLDYKGKPFGPVPHLLAIADRVDKLLAVCRKCGSDFACRTQRLVHSSEQILVGDAQYEARCLHCFEAPYEFQLKLSLPESTQPETHHVVERATSPQLSLVEDFGPDDNVRSELVPLVNVNQR